MTARNLFSKLILLSIIMLSNNLLAKKKTIHNETTAFFQKEQKNVSVSIEKLNPSNTSIFTKKKICKKFTPIKVTIKNNSKNTYTLSRSGINLNLIEPKKVAKKNHKSLLWTALWPASSTTPTKENVAIGIHTATAVTGNNNAKAAGNLLNLGTNLALTNHDNKRVTRYFQENATDLTQPMHVPSRRAISKIFYIENNSYRPNFNLKLSSISNNDVINFNVDLS